LSNGGPVFKLDGTSVLTVYPGDPGTYSASLGASQWDVEFGSVEFPGSCKQCKIILNLTQVTPNLAI
jgi:hypothetical protein